MEAASWMAIIGCLLIASGIAGFLLAQQLYLSASFAAEEDLLIGMARVSRLVLIPIGAVLLVVGMIAAVVTRL